MKAGPILEIFPYRPACVLRVVGPDSASFLQGQFSQDLRIASSGVAYGLWLNQKGKVVADSFVLREADSAWWVVSYDSPGAVVRARLEAFLIADDVEIVDETPAWTGMAIWGDEGQIAERLAVPVPASGVFAASDKGLFFRGRRGATPVWEWLSREPLPEWKEARRIEAAEAARRRILAGVPTIPAEVGEGDLPQEANLSDAALSYTKGCYLGQEVIARIYAMGQVRRSLRRVRGTGSAPEALPAPMFTGGKKCGELRAAVSDAEGSGWVGLAMIAALGLGAARTLSLSAEGPADITLVDSP